MRRSSTRLTLALMVGAVLAAAPACAQDPYEQPNNTWITIDGTVDNVMADRFTLDYGEGIITVEMDDGDRDADGYKLMVGDQVSVSGMVDDDLFETTTIEASSVYVENLDTHFYASALDDEPAENVLITTPLMVSRTVIRGIVTEVTDHEFVVDRGARSIRVEVDEMAYNPLDEDGYQRIEVGDYVAVHGMIDVDLFEGREMEARRVTTLVDASLN